MTKREFEQIKKKLNELEEQHQRTTRGMFAYIETIMQIFVVSGIISRKNFRVLLKRNRAKYKKASEMAQFLKMMQQVRKKKK